MTEDEDTQAFNVYRDVIANYAPNLILAQWLKILGNLVVDAYRTAPGSLLQMPQTTWSTSQPTITA
jgi:hypothetical protein